MNSSLPLSPLAMATAPATRPAERILPPPPSAPPLPEGALCVSLPSHSGVEERANTRIISCSFSRIAIAYLIFVIANWVIYYVVGPVLYRYTLFCNFCSHFYNENTGLMASSALLRVPFERP